MAKMATLITLLKYAPSVIGLVKQFRGSGDDGDATRRIVDAIVDTRESLEDFKRQATERIDELEEENARLRSRIREAESSLTIHLVLLISMSAVTLGAFVMALLALVARR